MGTEYIESKLASIVYQWRRIHPDIPVNVNRTENFHFNVIGPAEQVRVFWMLGRETAPTGQQGGEQ